MLARVEPLQMCIRDRVTAVAGLESGIIEPDTEIMDTGVYTYYQDDGPQCWYWRQYRRKHGLVNVSEALEVSCNCLLYTSQPHPPGAAGGKDEVDR